MAVRSVVMDDPSGREQVVTIAKLSWRVSPDGTVSLKDPPSPPRLRGMLRDGPGSSLRYPDDGVQQRPGTDVVMLGTAHPPADGPVTTMDVVLRVADEEAIRIDKTVRVHGPRVWEQGWRTITAAGRAELKPTPLIWENAYGGVDDSDPTQIVMDERNPCGRGVAREPVRLVSTLAPPLEDPQHPLSEPNPAPAGFGPIPSHWMPLSQYMGTFDDDWRRSRAPIRPKDYDPRNAGCAPPDQHCESPLRGDESYEIEGVLPDRVWRFTLPLYRPSFAARMRDEDDYRELETHLDTVFIDADEGIVELTWRASVPLPRVPMRLSKVRVGSTDRLPDHVHAQIIAAARAAQEASS